MDSYFCVCCKQCFVFSIISFFAFVSEHINSPHVLLQLPGIGVQCALDAFANCNCISLHIFLRMRAFTGFRFSFLLYMASPVLFLDIFEQNECEAAGRKSEFWIENTYEATNTTSYLVTGFSNKMHTRWVWCLKLVGPFSRFSFPEVIYICN